MVDRRRRWSVGLLIVAVIGVQALATRAPAAETSTVVDPPALVRDAIARTRALSFYRDRVDWPDLTERMLAASRQAKDPIDMIAAYDLLVAALDDGHSFVNVSSDDRKAYQARTGLRPTTPVARVRSPFIGRAQVEARRLAAGAGTANLIVVPAFSGGGSRGDAYAARLDAAVVSGASACGQVIDLRGNSGGNQWPMIAGLSALLGDSPQGLEIGPGGVRNRYAVLERGRVRERAGGAAGPTLAAVPDRKVPTSLRRQPVAVLIDGDTASSGAGVAIAFHGRPNTRFFGKRTHPTTSSNEGFVLADGTNIVVTSAMMADRNWTTFPGGMKPDDAVAEGVDATDAALGWLAGSTGCQQRHSVRPDRLQKITAGRNSVVSDR